jgi:hypothetical protein
MAFHGDNRGPTTSPSVTSRVKAWVVFDPTTGDIGYPSAKSDESSFVAIIPYTRTETPNASLSAVTKGKNSIFFKLHAFGANPLVPASPNIDMYLAMTANVDSARLNIHASLTGDQFPNVEMMLQDEAQERRMLATFETSGSAHLGPGRLLGNNRNAMTSICKSFPLNAQGRFL